MRPWSAFLAAVAIPVASILTFETATAAPVRPGQERPVPSPISDRFYLRGSYFAPQVNTDLRLDSAANGTMGTILDGEDDFGLDDRADQGRMEMMFRLRQRGRLRVNYFKLDRYGDTLLQRDINFGDQTFNVNDRVTSSFDLRELAFTLTMSSLYTERFELGLGIGVHLLEAQASGEVPAEQQLEEASGVGVFPSFVIDAAWRITQKISVTGRAQYFSVTVDDVSASLADYQIDAQYRWRPNLAFGIGYSVLRKRFQLDDDEFPGRFGLSTRGPEAFVRFSF